MPIIYLCGLGFSGITWTFKLLPSKHTETSVKFSRNFTCVDHTIIFGTWVTRDSGNVIYEKNGLLGCDFL
jgi:hypothetical protein